MFRSYTKIKVYFANFAPGKKHFICNFLLLKTTFNFTYFQSKFWSPLWSPLLSCFRPKSHFLHFIKYCKSILYTYISRLHNPEVESSNLSLATSKSPVFTGLFNFYPFLFLNFFHLESSTSTTDCK